MGINFNLDQKNNNLLLETRWRKMLEVGDICPDWNFVGPLTERINISMPPIAERFSILIFHHSQNNILESVF